MKDAAAAVDTVTAAIDLAHQIKMGIEAVRLVHLKIVALDSLIRKDLNSRVMHLLKAVRIQAARSAVLSIRRGDNKNLLFVHLESPNSGL